MAILLCKVFGHKEATTKHDMSPAEARKWEVRPEHSFLYSVRTYLGYCKRCLMPLPWRMNDHC